MPPAAEIPVRRVAIVAATRTGSSWLASLLDSHPHVRFDGELFNLESAPITAIRDPRAYLDERLSNGPHRVVGFKLLDHQARLSYLNDFLAEMDAGRPSDVDWRELFTKRPVTEKDAPAIAAPWAILRADGVGIIHLVRRNLLRRHISHARLMAESRARWRGTDAPDPPRVRLPAERLVSVFEAETKVAEDIDRFFSGSSKLAVVYEDLLGDFAAQSARILEFLELPVTALEPKRQIAQRPLRDSIENYAEVEEALRGTVWKRFLDER